MAKFSGKHLRWSLFFSKFADPQAVPQAVTEVSYKKGVLKDLAKFTGKKLCRSLFFNKFTDTEASTRGVLKDWAKFTGKHVCKDSGTGVFLWTLQNS